MRAQIFALWLVWTGSSLIGHTVAAADANAEERYKVLNSAVQQILENHESILKRQQELDSRLDRIERELNKLRDESRSSTQWATREDLKVLVDKLKEVDRNREADKKLLLEAFNDLTKVPIVAPTVEPKSVSEKLDVVVYKVEAQQTMTDILLAYNEKFKEKGLPPITLTQIEKANPGIDVNRIHAGQKINIPIPHKKK
jgi:hypothetical protein